MRWPEPQRVGDSIRKIAREIILPAAGGLPAEARWEKSPGQLVTEIDRTAESALGAELASLSPGWPVIGEEGVDADPQTLSALSGEAPVWVLDPVDGTRNFAEGSDIYAVIVALLWYGKTIAGWIYDPPRDRLAHAEAGQGAWVDGQPAHLAAAVPAGAMVGVVDRKLTPEVSRAELRQRAKLFHRTETLGCAAHQYLRLLTGAYHFATARRTKPWDHAAGVLMVEEAGGYAARIDGSLYRPADLEPALLIAPDRSIWRTIHEILTGPSQ